MARKRERSGDDISVPAKKKGVSEQRAICVNDLKGQLRKKHGSTYDPVQYAMWAEMLVGGGHDSMDEPPATPMFGAVRARGQTGTSATNMTEAFTALTGSIADALSPRQTNSGATDSRTKAVNLRGKYIQQLKELVDLREIGALRRNMRSTDLLWSTSCKSLI